MKQINEAYEFVKEFLLKHAEEIIRPVAPAPPPAAAKEPAAKKAPAKKRAPRKAAAAATATAE